MRFQKFHVILVAFVPENAISEKVQRFLGKNIHSVEQLEIFLTLAEEPARFWSVREIFQKVQSSEKSVASCLNDFLAAGVVRKGTDDTHRISDEMPDGEELAVELKRTYRERRVALIELIYLKPPPQIQSFADAFRLRKKS